MAPVVVKKKAIEATPESFQKYGQLVESCPDGCDFGPQDAQLDLTQGTPRFYIMRLQERKLKFRTIAHHARVTQCLGAVGGGVWYMGVAKSTVVNPNDRKDAKNDNLLQSTHGHFYAPPPVDEIEVFRISGPKFIKLDRGTWHAGPLFDGGTVDFYNLQLTDTDHKDHTDHDFKANNNVVFVIDE